MTILIGGPGSDTLTGGPGNDTLDGAGGADSLIGGKGNDTYFVDNLNDVVSELAGQGADTVRSSLTNTDLGAAAFANVENLILLAADSTGTGNALNNVITGNDSSNTLDGGAGKDTLIGGNGFDSLHGGGGGNLLIGGNGNDSYVIDQPGDKILEAASLDSGIDTVWAEISHTLAANVEQLFLTGGDAINGVGNAQLNFIFGNAAANKLSGAAGDDFLFGDLGNDTLDGGAGNDTLQGSSDSDKLLGGAGNDSLEGGIAIDTLAGGMGNDTYLVEGDGDLIVEGAAQGIDTIETELFELSLDIKALANVENLRFTYGGTTTGALGIGNNLNNLIVGAASGDLLRGEFGNDTLDGGANLDVLIGGKGNDVYIVDIAGDIVTEKFAEGTDTIQTSLFAFSIDGVANVENLVLLAGAVNGVGNALVNVITGNDAGNDLRGLDGNDTLIGGAGKDALFGGGGNNLLIGGTDDDVYLVDSSSDKIVETSGKDSGHDLVIATVGYTMGANVEDLNLQGSSALNIVGNASDNNIGGNTGDNKIAGLGGEDRIQGDDGNDTLDGGAGRLDFLNGGAGNDSLIGGAGFDFLDGGIGADTLAGGTGNDFYTLDEAGDVVKEAAGQGIDEVDSAIDYKLGANLENLLLLNGAKHGQGNDLNNHIGDFTAKNNSTLEGFGGNDTLDGADGDDLLIGGTGNDTYIIDSLNDNVTELDGGGIDTVRSRLASTDLNAAALGGVENIVLIGAAISGFGNLGANVLTGNGLNNILAGLDGKDTLIGDEGNDSLSGGDGNDLLNGEFENDSLDGGAGNDIMIGGDGNDIYVVGSTTDKVVELTGADSGFDRVEATVNYVLSANVEQLFLLDGALNGTGNAQDNGIFANAAANKLFGGAGNDDLRGEVGSDTLDGGAGNDSLSGGDDNDKLFGGAGNDRLTGDLGADSMAGGAGNDSYAVDNAADQVIEAAGQGVDIVTAFGDFTYTLALNVENLDVLLGADGTGNALANRIDGGGDFTGDNKMSGMDGNDTLVGGLGQDTMTGGAGRDTFAVVRIDGAPEIITDLAAGKLGDRLDLSDLLTGFTAGSSNPSDFVQFVNAAGDTTVRVDIDGAANGANFVDVCLLQGVTISNVNQAVMEGNLLLG